MPKKILLLEENDIARRKCKEWLEKRGHTVVAVSDAEDALQILDLGEKFDLICEPVAAQLWLEK